MYELFGFDAFSLKIAKAETLTFQRLVLASLCATFCAFMHLAQINKNPIP